MAQVYDYCWGTEGPRKDYVFQNRGKHGRGVQESMKVGAEQAASILATVGGIREAVEAKVGRGACASRGWPGTLA